MTIYDIDNYMRKNAKDYLERSVDAYNDEDYKLAIIMLWSGLLLFMKLRLFRINPVLIYERLEKIIAFNTVDYRPIYKEFKPNGNDKTINFHQILDRENQLGLDPIIKDNKTPLERIQRLRNRVEHFIDDITAEDYQAAIDSIMPFLNSFIQNEIGENLSDFFDNWDDFLAIDSLYQARLEEVREEISKREYLAATDGDICVTHSCPSCSAGEMIEAGDGLICGVCGYKEEYHTCSNCGTTFLDSEWSTFNDDISMCSDCFDGICERSD